MILYGIYDEVGELIAVTYSRSRSKHIVKVLRDRGIMGGRACCWQPKLEVDDGKDKVKWV